MNLQDAIHVLSRHNDWRRGLCEHPTNPTRLGEAIDLAIVVLECELRVREAIRTTKKTRSPAPQGENGSHEAKPEPRKCMNCANLAFVFPPEDKPKHKMGIPTTGCLICEAGLAQSDPAPCPAFSVKTGKTKTVYR